VLNKFAARPFPLYNAVLMEAALSWRSNYKVTGADLPDTTEAAFSAVLQSLEEQLGLVFVSHTLAYITVAHKGLSEVRIVFESAVTLFVVVRRLEYV